ncbi:hypothetical protein HHI36_023547 [Cryptolaemus montrouzieri]|uniref:Lipase domain-containing protein n=1 Tax=Cryptolaemus montrouzieri TaxID=559131 RepID=A0ABD2PHF8_9CUCU
MKLLLLLIGINTLTSAFPGNLDIRRNNYESEIPSSFITVDDQGNIRELNLEDTTLEKTPTIEDVTYYLYTRTNENNPAIINNNSITQLDKSGIFNPNIKTVFLIHGWNNDYSSAFNSLLRPALLKFYDINVFVVDWGKIANKNYFTAKFSVKTIGEFVGEFINLIADEYNTTYKNFTFIGHSLGAHVSAVAAANLKIKADLIIGLDPAEPLFLVHDTYGRLDPSDADFVHVIHTNAGIFGFSMPLGHADYYPNGGSNQPGCFGTIGSVCSHSRSYEYLADSILNKGMQLFALRCSSYRSFKKGKCNSSKNLSIMGRFEVDRRASGVYYLMTKSKEPYANDERPYVDILLDGVEKMQTFH